MTAEEGGAWLHYATWTQSHHRPTTYKARTGAPDTNSVVAQNQLSSRNSSNTNPTKRGPVLAITTQKKRNSHCDNHCDNCVLVHGCTGRVIIRRVSTNSTSIQINHEIGSILHTNRRRKEGNGSKRAQNSRHTVIALRGQCFNRWYIVLYKWIAVGTKRKVLVGNNRVVFHHC
jgi:hypothetical protein